MRLPVGCGSAEVIGCGQNLETVACIRVDMSGPVRIARPAIRSGQNLAHSATESCINACRRGKLPHASLGGESRSAHDTAFRHEIAADLSFSSGSV